MIKVYMLYLTYGNARKGVIKMFDKIRFRQKLLGEGHTLESISKEIGINPATLHRKMTGESDFTRKEIQKITKILNLSSNEMNSIFFAKQLT